MHVSLRPISLMPASGKTPIPVPLRRGASSPSTVSTRLSVCIVCQLLPLHSFVEPVLRPPSEDPHNRSARMIVLTLTGNWYPGHETLFPVGQSHIPSSLVSWYLLNCPRHVDPIQALYVRYRLSTSIFVCHPRLAAVITVNSSFARLPVHLTYVFYALLGMPAIPLRIRGACAVSMSACANETTDDFLAPCVNTVNNEQRTRKHKHRISASV
ncbi:hypothetical protein B0H12DRAFT_808017 [Mycena haematopus]|nr:hypothetical protein B0H12DRAFT_808017 [Mycena haematopus]